MPMVGSIFSICFVSSTSVVVQRSHWPVVPVFSEALSKNLQNTISYICIVGTEILRGFRPFIKKHNKIFG